LREELRLREFENRALKRIFGPKRDEVTGEWVSGVPRYFFGWGSKNSVEDRGQREWGSGSGSPLVSGSTQFANE
jgi:hypothetical protein